MKRLASGVLAGVLAISTIGAATTAAADGRHNRHYGVYATGNLGAAVAAGAILGFAFSALTAPRYVPPPYPYTYGYAYAYPPPPPAPVVYPRVTAAHITWCKTHYPWYNPATNTWTDQYGVQRPCVAPY